MMGTTTAHRMKRPTMLCEPMNASTRFSHLLRKGSIAAALAVGLLAPKAGRAQQAPNDSFSAERMRIALDGQGIIDTEWAAVPEHLTFDVGLWLNYEHNAIMLYSEADGHRYGALLKHRVDGALMGSIGLFGFAQLGIEVPGVLYQARDSDIPGATSTPLPSLTSSKLGDIRFQPKLQFLWASSAFFDVAVIPSFTIPSAQSNSFAGEKGATFQPELAVSKSFDNGMRFSTNMGAIFRRSEQLLNESIHNELEARVGLGYRFQNAAHPDAPPLELDLGLSGMTSASNPFTSRYEDAVELRGEATYHVASWISVFAGPGFGFGRSYSNPQWRAFAGARFAFGQEPKQLAAPPPAPVVAVENPPPAPALAPVPEPAPAPIAAVVAAPEPVVLPAKEPVRRRAKMVAERIEITEEVEFATGSDVISANSYDLLGNVAEVMKEHPEVKQFRVEGFTDSEGGAEKNLELSNKRAIAVVRYLVKAGIPAERLVSEGFGETHPLATNNTKQGRQINRRVEFHVVRVVK